MEHTLSLSNLQEHMIPIQGGIFEMGGPSVWDDAEPVHPVQLSDFALCRYPVSQQLWHEVMQTKPAYFQHPHRPVEKISLEQIENEFLPRLREKTGIADYCLPTEAQWEYAARGGIYRHAHADLPAFRGDFDYAGSDAIKEVAWYRDNSHNESYPLALKRPNALGLYDMSANVFEWVADGHASNYYQQLKDQYGDQPAPDPSGPEDGTG